MTPVMLMAEAATVDDVDVGRRLITGTVVPYGKPGRTNLGHGLKLRAGSVQFRGPNNRVLGVYGHRPMYGQPPKPYPEGKEVAVMVSAQHTAEAFRAQFRVVRTALGDQLLAEAADGVRSMMSIELDDVQLDPYGQEVVAGLCEYVAFVPLGAYDDAQVTSVIAQAHPTGVITLSQPQQPTQTAQPPQQPANGGSGAPVAWWLEQPQQQAQQQPQQVQQVQQQAPFQPWTPPQQVQQAQPPAVLAQPTWQPFQQAQPQPQQVQASAAPTLTPDQFSQLMAGVTGQQPGQQQQQGPAMLPGGLPTGSVSQQPEQPKTGHVLKASQLQAAMARGDKSPQLYAALADITNTGVDLFQSPAQAIGQELWSGGGYTRRFVQLMSHKDLVSWKFGGWSWDQTPKVAKYEGDKKDIPTNPVSVKPVEGEAERVAGGWDIDRKFRDFGDTAFWTGFYAAQTESYAEVTDLMAAAFIVSKAKPITTNANVPAGYVGANVAQADILRAAALASAILEDTPNVRRPADYILMNTGDWLGLMDFTGLELPAFLAMLGVKPDQFLRTSEVPAGSIVAGVVPALSHYELGGGVPIRVEALDVARAGIDSAVYGYVGHLENRPGGVISVPVTPAAAG